MVNAILLALKLRLGLLAQVGEVTYLVRIIFWLLTGPIWRIALALVNSDIDKQCSSPNTTVHSSQFENLGQDEIDEARVSAPLNKGQPTAPAGPSASSKPDVGKFFCLGSVSPTKPDQRIHQAPRKGRRKYIWSRFKQAIVRPASRPDPVDVVTEASR